MSGAGTLFALLLISSIPAIAVFLWFRLARYAFSPVWFSVSLLAGAASLFPALLFQYMLGAASGLFQLAGRWRLVAEIFIRIAFTEELSRLLVLVILLYVFRRWFSAAVSFATMTIAAGLIAGLGFAILESAIYGAANPGGTLLRAFTAAPLHAACGARVASAIVMDGEDSPKLILRIARFLSAVVIHGTYNFMILIPGALAPIIAVFIALCTFASSVVVIRSGMKA